MSNIAGALYRVTKIKNQMKCSRKIRAMSRQCQLKLSKSKTELKSINNHDLAHFYVHGYALGDV